VSSRRQRTKLFTEALTVVCELMRAIGEPRSACEKELQAALSKAYSESAHGGSRELPPLSAMASLNSRWHIEKPFVDKSGKPKPLSWNGHRGTLLKLAELVNGKEKAKRVVGDLVKRKLLVQTSSGKWLPKAQVLKPRGVDQPQVLRTAVMMQRLLRTIAHNSRLKYCGDELLFEVMTRVPRLPGRNISDFKKYARAQGMAYVSAVDDWLESRNLPKSSREAKNSREAGVVVFAFEEPSLEK
jgi:hypothetical protein